MQAFRPPRKIDCRALLGFLAFTLTTACLPRARSGGLGSEDTPVSSRSAASEASLLGARDGANAARPLVVALDPQTFRIMVKDEAVWNAALAVLMRNYNLTAWFDRSNGIITTEWDSYYLQQGVYRNRVSLRIMKLSYRASQLAIINNTEVLKETGTGAAGMGSGVWLPSDDTAGESARIVRNITSFLEQTASAPKPAAMGLPRQGPSLEPNAGPALPPELDTIPRAL